MPASPLISAVDLKDAMRTATSPLVLDVRWALGVGADREAFNQAHIPGAQFVDLDHDLSGPPGSNGRHPLPSSETFVKAMQRVGVNNTSLVVCYDERDGAAASRAWWLLRYYGHENVQVLDGGLAAWKEAGFILHDTSIYRYPGNFSGAPGAMGVIEVDAVLDYTDSGTLLDARATERFSGEVEPIDPVAGHIPGARNAPTTDNLEETGQFLSQEALTERFQGLGLTPESQVGVYCGSGITAAHEVLALEIAGIKADLYPGSWSEWCADSSRPVATGD